jgi:hypothetical protein
LSVYMVNANDGWAVGDCGEIIRWTGTEWVPEFSIGMILLFLVSAAFSASVLKNRRKSTKPKNGHTSKHSHLWH